MTQETSPGWFTCPGLTDGARVAVLHGDDALVSHVEPFPRDKDTTPTARDHRDRHQAALWHALALGGVNGRASDELDRIRNTLSTTMRDMCETRGLEVPEFRRRPMPLLVIEAEVARPTDRFDIDSAPPAPAGACRRCFVTLPTSATGPLCDDCDGAPEMCTADESPADDLRVTYAGRRGDETHSVAATARMAKWLHRHAANIALQENGAEICDEIEQVYRSITRVVNRPPEPMIIGPCITDPAPDEVLAERAAGATTQPGAGTHSWRRVIAARLCARSAIPRIRWPTCCRATSASSTTATRPCASSSTWYSPASTSTCHSRPSSGGSDAAGCRCAAGTPRGTRWFASATFGPCGARGRGTRGPVNERAGVRVASSRQARPTLRAPS
ncbi:Bacteriophage protein [Mycobacteroides abscessus subsp. bolletii]|nr:Bacteriophage protein [Mycobacteroides abscessus subsp. bolletii]SLD44243.1 Bacteriophage protein [Mycobacteroides abscessus subsp. bolletii]SLE84950.1 Bacteriophage protein [Mycobacteroides abscessus subsp. bolletii]